MDQDTITDRSEVELTALTAAFEASTSLSRDGGYFLSERADTNKNNSRLSKRAFDLGIIYKSAHFFLAPPPDFHTMVPITKE